jgi:hypothetical protein
VFIGLARAFGWWLEDGTDFLLMEFPGDETLAESLFRDAVPANEFFKTAMEMK